MLSQKADRGKGKRSVKKVLLRFTWSKTSFWDSFSLKLFWDVACSWKFIAIAHQTNKFLKTVPLTCLWPKYVNWFSSQFIVFCDYWSSHVVMEIDTNLFFGDPWITFGCFLPWTYSNKNKSNLFHLILKENIDCVCACVWVWECSGF